MYFVLAPRAVSEADPTSDWMIEKLYALEYQQDVDRSGPCREATWLKPNE